MFVKFWATVVMKVCFDEWNQRSLKKKVLDKRQSDKDNIKEVDISDFH
jgi:hypothetical protein